MARSAIAVCLLVVMGCRTLEPYHSAADVPAEPGQQQRREERLEAEIRQERLKNAEITDTGPVACGALGVIGLVVGTFVATEGYQQGNDQVTTIGGSTFLLGAVLLTVGGFLLLAHVNARRYGDHKIERLQRELGHVETQTHEPAPREPLPCCHQVGLSCGDDTCSCVGDCLGQ